MEEFSDQLIEDYLLGKLEGSDLIKFEAQLAKSKSLKVEVDRQVKAMKIVDAMGDLEMMKDIRQIHQKESKTKRPIVSIWKYAAAAGIALALGLCIWFLTASPSPATLYANYYEPFDLSFTARNNANDQRISKADLLYKSGDYKNALPIFESVFADDSKQSKIAFAIGICLMETNQEDKALDLFAKLSSEDFSLFKDHSIWYSALIRLKQGDTDTAKQLLQKLTLINESLFYEKANKLHSKL